MAAGRTLKSLVSRRRRVEDEGEDEEGPVLVGDSQSEGSVLSEPDEEEEGDASSIGDPNIARSGPGDDAAQEKPEAAANGSKAKKARKSRKKGVKKGKEAADESQLQQQTSFKAMTDTDAMMNGLKISDTEQTQGIVDFESIGRNDTNQVIPQATNGHTGTPAERQRREHEEYKKKRDTDPAFIPNRGNFFMHDTRGQPNGQLPTVRGIWQGRGRGRGGANVAGPFSPANQTAQAERAAEQPWKHDLHEAINEEPQAPSQPADPFKSADAPQDPSYSARLFPKPVAPRNNGGHRLLSFDVTTLAGKATVRVSLPGMKAPIIFSEVFVNKYIRLPSHRPPLRRDKPVRVFLPGQNQRYIFPTNDRSFIFIPRQMRPNQRGYHRGHYQRSIGGYGYSSRRTSMYGGSIYSPSAAASRRSSLAGISRENAFSPAGSFVGMPPSRPVVRLPHNAQHYSSVSTPLGPLSGQHTPTSGLLPQMHTYPLPQQPQFQGTPTTTVHQPRPQKAISVTGIESPALVQQANAEPQPFQNQLPAHMNEQPVYPPQPPPPPYFSPRQQYQYPNQQPQTGTPLSGIPEQAIHAHSFQPPSYGQPPLYGSYPPQPNYYSSPPDPNIYPQMPVYVVPPPQGYMIPPPAPPSMPPQQPPPQQTQPPPPNDEQQSQQSRMVAHESNGMVFYVPASEAQQSEHYQPAEGFIPSYAMPGLAPPTPAPDHQMSYYYTQMPPNGMHEVGTAVYYPAQQ